MKTLPLLVNKIEGSAKVAIIYDPADAASKEEANEIKAILNGRFDAPGDLKLTGTLVPVDNLVLMEGSRIAVLTAGLNAHYDVISTFAANNGSLTMSTDLSCVQNNKCVLGIVAKPRVKIYYSKLAAEAAKINFEPVFTMLITNVGGP